MTREQNIKAILETNFSGFKEEVIDIAVKKIIEIESCGDAISRQAVLDMLHDINAEVDDGCGFTYADWMDYIEQLPPVKPELSVIGSVLDKIRAEINELSELDHAEPTYEDCKRDVLEIIDRHTSGAKTEGEE